MRRSQSRREFLRSAARNVALGVLGLLAVALLRRRTGRECTNDGRCRGCASLGNCPLPRAARERRQVRRRPS